MNPAVLVDGQIEASERRNPYEILAKSMKHFRRYCPADKKVSFTLSPLQTPNVAVGVRGSLGSNHEAIRTSGP